MTIKDQIIKILQEITKAKEINLEFPGDPAFGDFTTNIALILAKKEGENPRKLAEEIKSKLDKLDELAQIVEKIEVAGPGFINFWLTKPSLVKELIKIQKDGEEYGSSTLGKGKTVVIDYSSPNIAKPFGIGHLRSTIIGQAIYNLYKTLGYEVVGDNHLGDWGTQFGKLLYMIESKKVTEFNIANLEELYVEFHKLAETDPSLEEKARQWFKKLEDGNPEAKSIWQKCVDVSIKEFDKVYELLGVRIDFAFGESYSLGEMKQMLNDSEIKKHLIKGEDGALIIDLAKAGIKTPLMFLKSDGATTYATRDLATIKFRVRKWNPDIFIYEVGAEQTLYFRQLFVAAKLLGLAKESIQFIHTAHGLYLAPDGKKFSTRKGKTIKLEEVLSEAIERAKKLGNNEHNVAQEVGVGAIKYFDLMHSVQSDVVFEWEKVMNMEGNSGPYLQYTVARTNSVLAKLAITNFQFPINLQINNEEMMVLRTLIKFPEIIEMAAKNYAPNLLCNFLYDLAQKYNGFYSKDKIIGSENGSFRLQLTQATGQVLKNGLKLLGISSPERM
jgi:arginyl-tRNA synthetase